MEFDGIESFDKSHELFEDESDTNHLSPDTSHVPRFVAAISKRFIPPPKESENEEKYISIAGKLWEAAWRA